MPTNHSAQQIETSLAEGESFADFAHLFDALMFLRQPYHQDIQRSEGVAGRLLCILVPDKPEKYLRAMQAYRLSFTGVSIKPALQAEFVNCVKNAALTVSEPEHLVWRPSLYFVRSPTLHENLEEWF